MFGLLKLARFCTAFLLLSFLRLTGLSHRATVRIGVALFILAFLPMQAFADTMAGGGWTVVGGSGGSSAIAATAPVDVTSSVMDVLMTIVTVIAGTILYIVRTTAARTLGIQITNDAIATFNTALIHGAHDFISDHLLKGGKLTIDLKSQAANHALQWANDHEPDVVEALDFDAKTLTQKAQAAAGQVMNGIMVAEAPAQAVATAPAAAT